MSAAIQRTLLLLLALCLLLPPAVVAERSERSATIHTGESIDLLTLLPSASYFDCNMSLEGGTISGTTFTAGQAGIFLFTAPSGETVTVTVISSDSAGTGETQTSTTPKTGESTPPVTAPEQKPETLTLTGNPSMEYGSSQTLHTNGGTGGTVTYTVEPVLNDGNAVVSSSGVMKATEVGMVLVTAIDGTTKSQPLLVEITPATIQISVKDKVAFTGSPVPALTESDYTVSGLVGTDKLEQPPTLSYTSTPDMTKVGTVGIRASNAQVPVGGNYDPDIVYIDGTLTIQEKKTYAVTVVQSIHGTLTADKTSGTEGETVTLTALPDASYTLKSLSVATDTGETVPVTNGCFSMPGANVTVTALFGEQEIIKTLPFYDVSEADWFYDSVRYVYQNDLMNGTSETAFSPYGITTRGMLVTILYRMEGSPAAPQRQPFGDVAAGSYYDSAVAWCAWNGIVNGTSPTTFSPDAPITREQLATIFHRYIGWKGLSLQGSGNLAQFSDESLVQGYAREAVGWAVGKGILSGKGDGILDPGGQATRAETAAILQRVKTLFGM